MAYRIGIDTGGTFTDMVIFNEDTREIDVIKVSSTPREPELAVLNALEEAFQKGVRPRP